MKLYVCMLLKLGIFTSPVCYSIKFRDNGLVKMQRHDKRFLPVDEL